MGEVGIAATCELTFKPTKVKFHHRVCGGMACLAPLFSFGGRIVSGADTDADSDAEIAAINENVTGTAFRVA